MSPEVIIALVRDKPGIKATELLVEYINNIREAGLTPEPTEELLAMVERMVRSGDLVEVEYVTPQMDYRIKSLYFPKGTEIHRPFNLVGKASLSFENQNLLERVLHVTGRTSGRMNLDDLANLMNAAREEGRTSVKESGECTCLSELGDDAYEPGGPSSGQKRPDPCAVHSPRTFPSQEGNDDPVLVTIANTAVQENLNKDGTTKYNSAQGYACAMTALGLYRKYLLDLKENGS